MGDTQVLRAGPGAERAVAAAAAHLRAGGLVAFPTETVYGLGADALNPAAVRAVFAAKGRPADNPLIVHLADPGDLGAVVAPVTPLARALAARWWPGPLTLVLQAGPAVPRVTTGGLSTVAVRVPAHPVAQQLIAAAGVPVAAPSANRSGRPSPTTAAHVAADLDATADLVILDGGACTVGVESTVVDARGVRPVVLREGAVTREDLGLVQHGREPDAADVADAERRASPGTRYRHYAPTCEVVLADPSQAPRQADEQARAGRRVGYAGAGRPGPGVLTLGSYRQASELAPQLYALLRAAEHAGVEVVVLDTVADTGMGRAVMDRLRRAASR